MRDAYNVVDVKSVPLYLAMTMLSLSFFLN